MHHTLAVPSHPDVRRAEMHRRHPSHYSVWTAMAALLRDECRSSNTADDTHTMRAALGGPDRQYCLLSSTCHHHKAPHMLLFALKVPKCAHGNPHLPLLRHRVREECAQCAVKALAAGLQLLLCQRRIQPEPAAAAAVLLLVGHTGQERHPEDLQQKQGAQGHNPTCKRAFPDHDVSIAVHPSLNTGRPRAFLAGHKLKAVCTHKPFKSAAHTHTFAGVALKGMPTVLRCTLNARHTQRMRETHVDNVAVQDALRGWHKGEVDEVGCWPQYVIGHQGGPELLLHFRNSLHGQPARQRRTRHHQHTYRSAVCKTAQVQMCSCAQGALVTQHAHHSQTLLLQIW